MQALDVLLNRVSVPRLIEPAPTQAQREVLFGAAMRAPDHGHLQPWRFLTVEGAAREQMGELLAEAAKLQDAEVTEAAIDKARNGPLRAPLGGGRDRAGAGSRQVSEVRAAAGGWLCGPRDFAGGLCAGYWRGMAYR